MKQGGEIGNYFQYQIQWELSTLMKKRRNHAKSQRCFNDIDYKFFATLRLCVKHFLTMKILIFQMLF